MATAFRKIKKEAAAAPEEQYDSFFEKERQEETAPVAVKRVSFYLPEPLYNDLLEFAEERGETMTGLFRWSLGLSKAIWDEIKAGNRIRVARDGKVVKEFLISPY